jgi:AcrR family transcriptional regulator
LSGYKVKRVESLRERKKAATRTVIADTAMQLFERFGYDHVSVERVAREAGVSKQTVFNYFPTKELLVFDRADEVREAMVAAVRDRPPGVSVVASFRQLTRQFWERFGALPDDRPQGGFFHVVDETPSLAAFQRELGFAIVADVAAVLRAEAGVGGDDPRPAVIAAALAAAHASVFDVVSRRVVAGESPTAFLAAALAAADGAYDLLEGGIGRWP